MTSIDREIDGIVTCTYCAYLSPECWREDPTIDPEVGCGKGKLNSLTLSMLPEEGEG